MARPSDMDAAQRGAAGTWIPRDRRAFRDCASLPEPVRQRFSRDHLRPLGHVTDGRSAGYALFDMSPGEQPQSFDDGQTPGRVSLLEGRPAIEHLAQPFVASDLDPAAADERQAVGSIEDHNHASSRSSVSVSPSRVTSIEKSRIASAPMPLPGALPRVNLHFRARRALRAPCGRHPHDDAGSFNVRHIGQEPMRLRGCPRERLEHGAAIDQIFRDGARPRGARYWLEQAQQRCLVACAGVVISAEPERAEDAGLSPARTIVSCRSPGRRRAHPGSFLFSRKVEADAPDEDSTQGLPAVRMPRPGAVPGGELVTDGKAAIRAHRSARTVGVRYSPPVIGGAAASASAANSSGETSTSIFARRTARSAVAATSRTTNARPTSRQKPNTPGRGVSGSAAPSRNTPGPSPRSKCFAICAKSESSGAWTWR